MTAPPVMDVYTGDLARSTSGMSAEVFGAYMRLLFYQWEHGKLPSRSDERQMVCGVVAERWDAVWGRISDRFELLDDDGNLGHPRITKDRPVAISRWARNKEIAAMRKDLGRKGGLAKAKAKAKQTDSNCSSKKLANLEGEGEGEVEAGKGSWKGKLEVEETHTQPKFNSKDIVFVIKHYKTYHAQSKPGKKAQVLIRARLLEGYTAGDVCKAIDGCHVSPFHCGENDRGKTYQSLELIVRDSEHVTDFMEAWDKRNAPVMSEKERRGMRASDNIGKRVEVLFDEERDLQ